MFEILRTRKLSLAETRRQAFLRFPAHPRCRIPHNLFNNLAASDYVPDFFQLFALSAVSGYRLVDWLRLFGFELGRLSSAAFALPTIRTRLLDLRMHDDRTWIPWPAETDGAVPPIAPLSQILHSAHLHRLRDLPGQPSGSFLYAQIGRQDDFAFPELLPESIIRVDTREPHRFLPLRHGERSRALFLTEHRGGLVCCRLRSSGPMRVTLVSSDLAFAETTFELGRELRVLGVVDLEIRTFDEHVQPEVPRELAMFQKPSALPSARELKHFGTLVRTARIRSGLSLRMAANISRRIAETLGDRHFAISASSLAAYEKDEVPPRSIHKILSLGSLYSIGLEALVETAGIRLEEAGNAPFPEEPQAPKTALRTQSKPDLRPGGFLSEFLSRIGEIPYSLRDAFRAVSGIPDLSLRDIFWVGGMSASFHPYLRHALFVVVDRRRKGFRTSPSIRSWEQPIHVLSQRDGGYLLGSYRMEGNSLVIYPFSHGLAASVRFLKRTDVEVVGKVVSIVRRIPTGA